MKNILIITMLFALVFSPDLYAQKKAKKNKMKSTSEQEFRRAVTDASDRLERMQSNGKLSLVQYEDEIKMVRKAEQLVGLLDEGHEVSQETMNEWMPKLRTIGVDKNKEGEGIQYRKDPKDQSMGRGQESGMHGEYNIMSIENKINNLEKKLKNSQNLSAAERDKHLEMITNLRGEVEKLKNAIDNLNISLDQMSEQIKD